LYYASISAVNPIFGALLYVARTAFRLKAYWFIVRHYRTGQRRMTALDMRAKVEVRPKVAELEIFGEVKAAVAA
jgi:hypothetical protein